MMKKRIIILALFFPALLCAQTDPQAKSVLDKTVALLQKSAVETNFSVVYENAATNEREEKQGELKIKGNKFYLALNGMELYFDGKTQWMYLKEADEVSVSEPTGKELMDVNPLLMVNEFRKTHRVQFDSDDAKQTQFHLLNLYPGDVKADHFKVALKVNRETRQITSIRISFKNGTSTMFNTKNYKVLQSLDDSNFTFQKSKHPNVIINDLR